MTRKLDRYIPARPADEPHQKRCQKARLGQKHACTCESNTNRWREGVYAAGRADDREVLKELGNMGQLYWYEGRRQVDPTVQNPYTKTYSRGA